MPLSLRTAQPQNLPRTDQWDNAGGKNAQSEGAGAGVHLVWWQRTGRWRLPSPCRPAQGPAPLLGLRWARLAGPSTLPLQPLPAAPSGPPAASSAPVHPSRGIRHAFARLLAWQLLDGHGCHASSQQLCLSALLVSMQA